MASEFCDDRASGTSAPPRSGCMTPGAAVRDLEVSGRRMVWMRRRLVCGGCDSRWLEEHPEFDGRLTRRLAQRLVADAQVMTIRAVVRRHGVSGRQ